MSDDIRVWDVVVVGAGPAGSSAARAAAQAGASVLVVDRAEFPRYKTCAGGLIGASLANIPDSVLELVEDRSHRAVFTLRGRSAVTVERAEPFLGMVQRERFDAALLDCAIAAGATFRGHVTVRELRDSATHVELETSAGILRAKVVVGCDGSASRVARHVGVRYRLTDLGLEDEIRVDPEPWRGSILIDWGRSRGSYAWLFPKEDTIAIGVIQRTGEPDATRAYLAEWRTRLGLDDAQVLHSNGHLTHSRERDSPLCHGRVIVAGDAAGMLEPWLREGISFALRSGTWAGEAAAAASADPGLLDRYVQRVQRDLVPEQRSGALLLTAYERVPRIIHWALSSRPGQAFFVKYGRTQTTLAAFWRAPWVMRLAEVVARPFR